MRSSRRTSVGAGMALTISGEFCIRNDRLAHTPSVKNSMLLMLWEGFRPARRVSRRQLMQMSSVKASHFSQYFASFVSMYFTSSGVKKCGRPTAQDMKDLSNGRCGKPSGTNGSGCHVQFARPGGPNSMRTLPFFFWFSLLVADVVVILRRLGLRRQGHVDHAEDGRVVHQVFGRVEVRFLEGERRLTRPDAGIGLLVGAERGEALHEEIAVGVQGAFAVALVHRRANRIRHLAQVDQHEELLRQFLEIGFGVPLGERLRARLGVGRRRRLEGPLEVRLPASRVADIGQDAGGRTHEEEPGDSSRDDGSHGLGFVQGSPRFLTLMRTSTNPCGPVGCRSDAIRVTIAAMLVEGCGECQSHAGRFSRGLHGSASGRDAQTSQRRPTSERRVMPPCASMRHSDVV